jgi:hypothetical protein
MPDSALQERVVRLESELAQQRSRVDDILKHQSESSGEQIRQHRENSERLTGIEQILAVRAAERKIAEKLGDWLGRIVLLILGGAAGYAGHKLLP